MAGRSGSTVRTMAEGMLQQLDRQATRYVSESDVAKLPAGEAIFTAEPSVQAAVALVAAERFGALQDVLPKLPGKTVSAYMNLIHRDGYPHAAVAVLSRLLRRKLSLTETEFAQLVNAIARVQVLSVFSLSCLPQLVAALERHWKAGAINKPLTTATSRLARCLAGQPRAAEKRLFERLCVLLAGPSAHPLEPGEAWADAAIADLNVAARGKRDAWCELLIHCRGASGANPPPKWLSQSRTLLKSLGQRQFRACVLRWFPLVDKPRTSAIEEWSQWTPNPNLMISDTNRQILKGLAFCCVLYKDDEVARAVTDLAISAYRKVPLRGPRAVMIGNACVGALGAMPGVIGVGQLAVLKARIKFGTAQKLIENALDAAAKRLGLPADEIEELAVPTFGLTQVGESIGELGDSSYRFVVNGLATEIRWERPKGKPVKSVPASVKKEFANQLNGLKTQVKDIQRMLSAQCERLDRLFLSQRSWPFPVWCERYGNHPLVGTLARRLIWRFATGKRRVEGILIDNALTDRKSRILGGLDEKTSVTLWHPIHEPVDEVLAWREFLEEREIRQPLKQAHREVYLLTDAERATNTYSNRFAAHVIRQHQFHALCGARGWRNKLRLMVDAEIPPATRDLSPWDLRAEFWIEGIGGDYGVDTNEAGAFRLLSTDQVRFYPSQSPQRRAHAGGGGYYTGNGADSDTPLELAEVPPLVFSEVMRDVDLFVGVASVGNDPTWADGGPAERHRDYWTSYAWGALSEAAKIRVDVLRRLVPRLAIADRCSFTERFLEVRGNLRTYKIHCGSANILMQPNDQYLCIVPSGRSMDNVAAGRVFLPFEGDERLGIIISKALLLADDDRITDPTIVRQIRSGT